MAAYAGGATPCVARHAAVIVVCFRFPVFVAVSARDDLEVRRHLVAFDAIKFLVWAGRYVERMIEGGSVPGIRVVAGLTFCGKPGCRVVRVCCGIVVRQVARSAIVCDSGVSKDCSLP